MSFSEKTLSVPSSPMGFPPGADERGEPEKRRAGEQGDDHPSAAAGRRELARIEESGRDQSDRKEQQKEEHAGDARDRAPGEDPVGYRQHEGGDAARGVPGLHAPL